MRSDELGDLAGDHADGQLEAGRRLLHPGELEHAQQLRPQQHRHCEATELVAALPERGVLLPDAAADLVASSARSLARAQQLALDVEQPERSGLPAERIAHHSDESWGRLVERCRFGEHARDTLLGGESLLGLLALGHVEQVALREERPVVPVGDDEALVLYPDDAPVAADQAVLGAKRLGGPVAVLDEREDSLAIFGMEELHEHLRIVDPLLGRIPEQRVDLRAREEAAGGRRECVDVGDERQLLDERLVFRLGVTELDRGRPASTGEAACRTQQAGAERTGERAHGIAAGTLRANRCRVGHHRVKPCIGRTTCNV